MGYSHYPYKQTYAFRYSFLSKGKKSIIKIVEFTPTRVNNIFNLGFGDLLPNSKIDDTANSNNGDIIKVISTVIQIISDFTEDFPHAKIVFTGSTPERTVLYKRILKTYLELFSKTFIITALVATQEGYKEVLFEPMNNINYSAFFVKRIG